LSDAIPTPARMWIIGSASMPSVRKAREGAADSLASEFRTLRNAVAPRLPLSRLSLSGFASAKIAVEAMRRVGANPSGADLRDALRAMQRYDVERLASDYIGAARAEGARRLFTLNVKRESN